MEASKCTHCSNQFSSQLTVNFCPHCGEKQPSIQTEEREQEDNDIRFECMRFFFFWFCSFIGLLKKTNNKQTWNNK